MQVKLLIVHNRYRTNITGGEDVVFDREYNALKKQLGSENVFAYTVSNEDAGIFYLLFNILFSIRHYKAVSRIIKKNNIDLMHVHNFFPMLSPSIFFAAKKNNVKTVITLHSYRLWCVSGVFYREGSGICELCTKQKINRSGMKYKCFRDSFIQSVIAGFSFAFYKLLRLDKIVDAFFVLTSFQKKKVAELGIIPEKIHLKPNFLPEDVFRIEKQRKNKYQFIYAGRLETGKGVRFLIEKWEELPDNFILNIVGNGYIREEVIDADEKMKNINYLGQLSNDETMELISQSSFLLHPSFWYESFGLTIIEAMALGVPVIGFDIGPRTEFINNGKNGFIVEPEKFVSELIRIAAGKNYVAISKQCIKDAGSFSHEKIIEKQILLYSGIIKKENVNQ